jgi:hypothetical protein
MPTINLKLPLDTHKGFYKASRGNGATMQAVLAAFVAAYIEHPEYFKIKLEVSRNGNNHKPGHRA